MKGPRVSGPWLVVWDSNVITCDIYIIKHDFDAYLSINDFIFMHVIIFICIFLLLYEKSLYSQKYFKLGLKIKILR